MRKIFSLLAVSAVLATALSCSDGTVYDKFVNTPIAGWEKNDTLSFGVPRVPAGGQYASSLMLRISQNYPFMSLTIVVTQKVLPSGAVLTDTLRCPLIDKHGRTKGTGLSYYQYAFPVRSLELAQGDSVQVSVRHDMKREILPGVSDVGLKVVRVR